MKKRLMYLFIIASAITWPLQAMQVVDCSRTKEDCWTTLKYVASFCCSQCFKSKQPDHHQEDKRQERGQLLQSYVIHIKESMTENDFRLRFRKPARKSESCAGHQ